MCSCKFMIQIQSSEEIRVSGRVLLYYSYFQFYQHSKSNTITLLPLQNGICSYCIIPFRLYTCVKYRYIYKYNCPGNLRSKYHPYIPSISSISFRVRFYFYYVFLRTNRAIGIWNPCDLMSTIWRINANVNR